MGWDIRLKDRKTGDTIQTAAPMVLFGSNLRCDENLRVIAQRDAAFSATFNYSKYYYEAAERLPAFWRIDKDGESENLGFRAFDGLAPWDSIVMLKDLIDGIINRYRRDDGTWFDSERKKQVFYDEQGHEMEPSLALLRGYSSSEELVYYVNEGDRSDYWESTAANALAILHQMLLLASDVYARQLDCVWEIC